MSILGESVGTMPISYGPEKMMDRRLGKSLKVYFINGKIGWLREALFCELCNQADLSISAVEIYYQLHTLAGDMTWWVV